MKRLILILGLLTASISGALTTKWCGPVIESYGSWERTNESGVTLQYDPSSRVLYISKGGRVISRVSLRRQTLAFRDEDWFASFAETLRVGEPLEFAKPFLSGSLERHFESHAIEFAIIPSEPGAVQRYGNRALAFAQNSSDSAISFSYYDASVEMEKVVKFDIFTNEVVVVAARRGNILTYYKVDGEQKRRVGLSGSLEYVLGFYARQIQ